MPVSLKLFSKRVHKFCYFFPCLSHQQTLKRRILNLTDSFVLRVYFCIQSAPFEGLKIWQLMNCYFFCLSFGEMPEC